MPQATKFRLFTDGSVHPQSHLGYGAALWVTPENCSQPLEELRAAIQIFRFTETSSTKIELQTLLHALNTRAATRSPLIVYTDSQNILSLLHRRMRLESQNYLTKKGTLLKNATLYRSFYQALDQIGFSLIKIKGHRPSSQRGALDDIFKLVDQAARQACRAQSITA